MSKTTTATRVLRYNRIEYYSVVILSKAMDMEVEFDTSSWDDYVLIEERCLMISRQNAQMVICLIWSTTLEKVVINRTLYDGKLFD